MWLDLQVKSYGDEDPLILFSGDCFNPSLLSTITKVCVWLVLQPPYLMAA